MMNGLVISRLADEVVNELMVNGLMGLDSSLRWNDGKETR